VLVIDATDKAVKMTLGRKNAMFEGDTEGAGVTDSAVIEKLIVGLEKDVASTSTTYEKIVQYYATDWDMMLTRADFAGLVVIVESGKVTVKPPATSAAPVLTVKFGDSMFDFQAELNAATQYAASAVQSWAWDADTQKLAQSQTASSSVSELGNLSASTLAETFNISPLVQQTGAPVAQAALSDWSNSTLMRDILSKVSGHVSFDGSALIKAGGVIELAGVGARFNGNAYVTAVQHAATDGSWTTTAYFGLPPESFAARTPSIADPQAAGHLPPVRGLHTGVVQKVAPDAAGGYRAFIGLPLLQSDTKGVWARLASFYASNGFGAVFYPEVNDEVVVGFMNEDPRFPVILGSLYSKGRAPAYPPDQLNNKKAIVSRKKLEITFDDDKTIFQIKSPAPQTITVDDTAKTIVIKDCNGNSLTMSDAGVAIDSPKDVTITAKGSITLDAKAAVSITAATSATVSAKQITATASGKFSAEGTSSAQVTSGGILTLQGSLVKIN
jgi:uncharacterized protein involved in type VI secretion and phage assembly